MGKKVIAALAAFLIVFGSSTFTLADTPSAVGTKYYGVDIYHGDSENNQVNWSLLSQEKTFVYIKSSEGISYTDPMWKSNVNCVKTTNMLWGPYHFIRFNSNPISQADGFWNRIKGTGFSLIPAVDVESYDVNNITSQEIRTKLREFISEFQRVSGITPIVYTYTSYANANLKNYFTDCKLWLADYRGYAGDVVGWGVWHAWQYSEKGNVDAIANDEVDLDIATSGIFLNSSTEPASSTPSQSQNQSSSRTPVTRTVTGGSFYVRTGPGSQYSIVTSVSNGFNAIGWSDTQSGSWFELTNGQYISNKAFSKSESKTTTHAISSSNSYISVGSYVSISSNAKYGGQSKGKLVPSWVKAGKYKVLSRKTINGETEALLSNIDSWVPVRYLFYK